MEMVSLGFSPFFLVEDHLHILPFTPWTLDFILPGSQINPFVRDDLITIGATVGKLLNDVLFPLRFHKPLPVGISSLY